MTNLLTLKNQSLGSFLLGLKPIVFFLFLMTLGSCVTWEENVTRNGIEFSRFREDPQGPKIGFMKNDRLIAEFPCRAGWIQFRGDWSPLALQLSESLPYKGTVLPAMTWIHFPESQQMDGYTCVFPRDQIIQGMLCAGSGGFDGTQTSFYSDGHLRSFYPPKDVIINGIPCKATPFEAVVLYKNGAMKSFQLSLDIHWKGKLYQQGTTLHLDEDGNPIKLGS